MFRSPPSFALIALLFTALACGSDDAQAVQTYCVGTVAELRTALDQSEADGEDSRIDLRAGTYNFTSELRFDPTLEYIVPVGSLTIEGGYGLGCSSRVDDASLTVLHSNNGEAFVVSTESVSVMLKTMTLDQAPLTFIGNPALGENSCVSNNLKFEARRLRMSGGKLETTSQCHDIILRDSLFTNASDGTAIDVYLLEDDDHVTTSLTMVNNTVAEGRLRLGSCCDYQGAAFLYNNVFRNAGTEIAAVSTDVLAYNNRYDSLVFSSNGTLPAGSLLGNSSNNVSSNPDLDANYRPNVASPMVNSGTSSVPDGLLSIDLYGGPRIVGPRVDRGAIESPVDGSGVFTVTNTNASGSGSLAEAVALANAAAGYNIIKFNIAGSCPRRIVLSATLSLQGATLIDGWTQPGSIKNTGDLGWNATPCVILDGNGTLGTGILTASQLGTTGNLQIRGLAFEGFSAAMLLSFGSTHLVFGNQFGGRVGTAGPTLSGNDIGIIIAGNVSGTVVGGSDEANRNLIGSSATAGVQIIGASTTNNKIVNNLIGLDKNAGTALANLDGIYISSQGNSITQNRIARNTRDGIVLTSANAHDNTIADNILGGSLFTGPLVFPGNGRMGVFLDNDAHDNIIGPGNAIGKNGDSGVRVMSAAGGRNKITANQINLNGSPGIDLGANGVTANNLDPILCDATLGCAANRGQNFPVLQSALLVGTGNVTALSIAGRLTTVHNTSAYRIDFYRSAACNVSGHGEGSNWIGSKNVVVSNSGICASSNCGADFSYGVLNNVNAAVGDAISATATSPFGDTSEFSACTIVEAAITDRIFANGFE